MKRLGLIHTSATLVPIFEALCAELLPGVSLFNIADDSLIKEVIAEGRLTTSVSRRVASHVIAGHEAGADQLLVTCSSIGPAVERAAQLVETPVLRVDQPMADLAVAEGAKIGVAATLSTTLDPTADLIERRAGLAGREVQLDAKVCSGAFEALMAGDTDAHDNAVSATLHELAAENDLVVLAQASMARVADQITGVDKPILSSPRLAIQHLATLA